MTPPSFPRGKTVAPFVAPLLLGLSLFAFLPQLRAPFSRVFLGLDMAVIFRPILHWVAADLKQGRLPLVTDLALHGAPFSAMSPLGCWSPPVAFLFTVFPEPLALNLLSALPIALLLFGAYAAGRALSLSRSASCLCALLWAYNGTQLVHLDHVPLTWANAFFPWVFLCFLERERRGDPRWLWGAAALWGLSLLTGHFQLILMQGFFFLAWSLWPTQKTTPGRRLGDLSLVASGAALLASPRILHTWECLFFDPAWRPSWGQGDAFFHSWWPVNAVTLFFPWFFGKFQYDGAHDFWWRYHFNETQAALSVGALFFILYFFLRPHPRRKPLAAAGLFGLAMALGEWSPLYRLACPLPPFSFFRDPARWWFLVTWAAALAAAYGWDAWFAASREKTAMRRVALVVTALPFLIVAAGKALLGPGLPVLQSLGAWLIRRFVAGDSLHPLPPEAYLERLPEKLSHLARSLDISRWEVWLPLALVVVCCGLLFARDRSPVPAQKAAFLALILLDLWAFQMPFGASIVPLAPTTRLDFPAPQSRLLSLSPDNRGPYDPLLRGRLAFPNTQLLSGVPGFNQHLGRSVPRYEELDAKLGWFAWVYKDRDILGWAKRPTLLRTLGIDRVVSDAPLQAEKPFRSLENSPLPAWDLPGGAPRAQWVGRARALPWPEVLDRLEDSGFQPLQEAWLDRTADFPLQPSTKASVETLAWTETRLAILSRADTEGLVVLRKTFLPGWKAFVEGRNANIVRCDGVLMGVPVPAGENTLLLVFHPSGLRLGFFLAWVFLGFGAGVAVRRAR